MRYNPNAILFQAKMRASSDCRESDFGAVPEKLYFLSFAKMGAKFRMKSSSRVCRVARQVGLKFSYAQYFCSSCMASFTISNARVMKKSIMSIVVSLGFVEAPHHIGCRAEPRGASRG